jgi:hypothetical protein
LSVYELLKKKLSYIRHALKKPIIILLSFILLIAFACVKDYRDAKGIKVKSWPANLGIPLIDTKLSAKDLAETVDVEDLMEFDQDGLIILKYSGELASIEANEIASFPDTSVSFDVPGFVVVQSPISLTRSFGGNIPEGMKIEHMDLRSGESFLKINSRFSEPGKVRVVIPALTKDGVAFDEEVAFNTGSTANPSVHEKVVDLNGYSFDFTLGTPAYNQFDFDITLEMDNNFPGFNDSLGLEFGYRDLEFIYLDGDFGPQLVSLDQDSIYLDLFSKLISGDISFTDASLDIDIESSFGFPVDVEFTSLEVLEIGSANPIVWTPTGPSGNFPNPFTILNPDISQVGQSVNTSLFMDRNNSNIDQLVGTKPKWLYHQIKGVANADSNTALDFMTDTSSFVVNTTMRLPLKGEVRGIILRDTVDFGLNLEEEPSKAALRIGADNGFPVSGALKIVFMNESFSDSIVVVDDEIFEAGQVNSEGKVVQASSNLDNPVEVELSKTELQKMLEFSKVIVDFRLSSKDLGEVSVYDSDEMRLRAGIKLEFD